MSKTSYRRQGFMERLLYAYRHKAKEDTVEAETLIQP
jgi:hypothetical protein